MDFAIYTPIIIIKMCHETWSLHALKTRLSDVESDYKTLKEKVESSFLHAYYLGPRLESTNELMEKLINLINCRFDMSIHLETYGITYFE